MYSFKNCLDQLCVEVWRSTREVEVNDQQFEAS